MTKRKADIVRIAEALGIEPEPGQTAGELAERCAERAAELKELVDQYESEAREAERSEAPPAKVSAETRRQQREHELLRGAGVQRAEAGPAEAKPASQPKRERKSSRKVRSEVEA
jgi:hypothetical protein